VVFYESNTVDLVRMSTGKHLNIRDDPVFSPDGLRFAVAKDDQMVGRGIFRRVWRQRERREERVCRRNGQTRRKELEVACQ
jgi:hypothetical protein